MKKTKFLMSLILVFTVSSLWAFYEDLQVNKIIDDRIKKFPVPKDNRNYFFLHAYEKRTNIIIGDFSGLQKMIVMLVDENSDNKLDRVIEYFPESGKTRISRTSSSRFFTTDIEKLKRDIIEGTIYEKKNYTDEMKSINICKAIFTEGDRRYITRDTYGYIVKYHEVDNMENYSAVFSFGQNSEGYYLQFRTDYYRKDYNTTEEPILKYSVFCKKSSDPVVKNAVEELLKIRK